MCGGVVIRKMCLNSRIVLDREEEGEKGEREEGGRLFG